MIYAKTISIAAVLALASQAIAEPVSRNMAYMSTRELSGLESRDDSSYNPKQSVCGMGSDCSSCGTGFQQCSSTDGYIHCYNAPSNATCCNDGSGNSCDAGYFCYPARLSKTLCCPDGIDADTCKSKYGASLTTILPSSTLSSSAKTSAASSTAITTPSVVTSAPSASPTVVDDSVSGSQSKATNATITHSNNYTATAAATGSSSSSTGTASTSGSVTNAASYLVLFGAAMMAAALL